MNTMTLPPDWYSQQKKTDDDWPSVRLVSSLRQHTQWKHSPAFGHQARNNSAASLWPERDESLSREALLADHISLQRRLRQGKDRCAKESTDTKRRRQSEPSKVEPKHHCVFPSRNPHRLRTSRAASKVMRGLRLRNVSDDGHRCSFEPFLRSENHPVFVQPIKDYVVKRLGVFHSRSRKPSSISASSEGIWKRPNYQRCASSTSKDSIQLNGRIQLIAMIQGSGTPPGQLAPDAEVSSNASAGTEQILTSAEASDHAQATAKSEPLTAIENPRGDLPMGNADYFHYPEWDPRHLLRSPELGQIRNRTSTSGTTVYNPPLIAEASPNSKKLESDESTSSGTSCGIRDLKTLYERER